MNYNDIIKYIDNNNDININILYDELINNVNKDILDFILYDKFNYEHIEEVNETIEEKIKRYDSVFKKSVKEKYKKCMITGKPLYMCQVAHIYPFSESDIIEKYDINNGLLLSIDLHLLFDNFKFIIDPDTHIVSFTDDVLNDDSMSYYITFHNTKIDLNNKNIYYLKKKYENIIKN